MHPSHVVLVRALPSADEIAVVALHIRLRLAPRHAAVGLAVHVHTRTGQFGVALVAGYRSAVDTIHVQVHVALDGRPVGTQGALLGLEDVQVADVLFHGHEVVEALLAGFAAVYVGGLTVGAAQRFVRLKPVGPVVALFAAWFYQVCNMKIINSVWQLGRKITFLSSFYRNCIL